MKTLGIIGYPLGHSFSKKYFDAKIEKEGLQDVEFKTFQIPQIEMLDILLSQEKNLAGLAVTIPYKKDVIPYLSEMSDDVRKIGACNCIRISQGKLYGYNTDVIGFEASFSRQLQPHHTRALVLGTGGAAAAVEFVLKKKGIRFISVSRKPLANQLTYLELNEKIMTDYTVIINCTPLGTFPQIEEAPDIPYHFITSRHYCFDLVYNPPVTKFLRLAEARGASTCNGYEMLEIQAEENWKIWNQPG